MLLPLSPTKYYTKHYTYFFMYYTYYTKYYTYYTKYQILYYTPWIYSALSVCISLIYSTNDNRDLNIIVLTIYER